MCFKYIRIEERCLSCARNIGLDNAANEILLFIDADALAEPDWAYELAVSLARPGVTVAGGRILPKWHAQPILLWQAEIVMDQYSILDLGTDEQDVSRIVGTNFGVNRVNSVGEIRFDEAYGRRRGQLFGGEESDLCKRAIINGGNIIII